MNVQKTVDSAFSIISAAQGGFAVGNGSNAFETYNAAINLASTFAAQGPFAIGLNSAAAANNSVAAVSAFQAGKLQPSDMLGVASNALSLAVAAAAVAGAPVTFSAVVLAGVVSVASGPFVDEYFNAIVNSLAQKITDGLLRDDLAFDPVQLQQHVPQRDGGTLIQRGYSTDNGEIYSFEIVYADGRTTGEVGRTVLEGWLPETTVRVTGSFADPTGFEFTDFPDETNILNATKQTAKVWQLNSSQIDAVVGAIHAGAHQTENVISFNDRVISAAGITGISAADLLISGTKLEAYAFLTEILGKADKAGWMYSQTTGNDIPANMMAAVQAYWPNPDYHFTGSWFDAYQAALEGFGKTKTDEMMRQFRQEWLDAGGSPIALDLDGNGIGTIAMNKSSVNFDITGDSIKERVGWLNADDAFLAMDHNKNGLIDNASELFGGMQRGQGFEKLAALDKNDDDFLRLDEDELDGLYAWKDSNSNGITDAGELMNLAMLGIKNINLKYESKNSLDTQEHGNYIGEVSTATTADGSMLIADLYFQYTPIIEQDEEQSNGAQNESPIPPVALFDKNETLPGFVNPHLVIG
ncbi:hypothetical protein GN316_13940 [Xylophilus sp. Kf1]|nr:hypothetical protein [Xylophilus sp. Kf1]